jgi:hypothetical protein
MTFSMCKEHLPARQGVIAAGAVRRDQNGQESPKPNSFAITLLRALELSCPSFSCAFPLFSAVTASFRKTPGVG